MNATRQRGQPARAGSAAGRRAGFAALAMAALLGLLLALTPAQEAEAQTVRGRIVFPNGYPANGAAVRVFNQRLGPSGFAYTTYDGMYYLNGIPPGDYELQVFFNGGPNTARPIRVFPQPMTDIPPISLRF